MQIRLSSPASSLGNWVWHNQQKAFAANCKFCMLLGAGIRLWALHEVGGAASLHHCCSLSSPCRMQLFHCAAPHLCSRGKPWPNSTDLDASSKPVPGRGRKSLPAQWCGFFWCLPGLIQSSIILSTMLALCTEDSKAGSFKGPAQNKSRCSLVLVSSGFYLCFFFFFFFFFPLFYSLVSMSTAL